MKSSLAVLFLILALAAIPVFASSDSQYLVVVGKDAPASDVVLGANFAASMKATLGVTFASAIDTDLYSTVTNDDLAAKTIVVIDGADREVRILGTSNAAAAADTYFTRQGFKTAIISSPRRSDVLVDQAGAQDAEQVPQDSPEQDTTGQGIDERAPTQRTEDILAVPAEQPAQPLRVEPQVTQPEQRNEPPAAPPAPQQEPGFFSRIADWFRNLF